MEIQAAALQYIQNANLPTGWLSTDMQAQAVADALATYSRLFPRELCVAASGNGTAYLTLSSLIGWVVGFSEVSSIEYPYTAAALGENVLHDDTWEVVTHPTNGATLRFLEDVPAATAQILVAFTVLHADGAVTATVRRDHVGACAKLAASYMALSLSARASSNKESTVGGSWNGQSMAGQYGALAKKLRTEAEADLGTGADAIEEGAVSEIQAIDMSRRPSHGYGLLTHRRRRYS